MKLTKVMRKKYIKGAAQKCPYCNSNELEADSMETDCTGAWREVSCTSCGKKWNEVFTLTDIEEIREI